MFANVMQRCRGLHSIKVGQTHGFRLAAVRIHRCSTSPARHKHVLATNSIDKLHICKSKATIQPSATMMSSVVAAPSSTRPCIRSPAAQLPRRGAASGHA